MNRLLRLFACVAALLLVGGGLLLLHTPTTSASPSSSESPTPDAGDDDTTPPDDGQDSSDPPETCSNNRQVVIDYLEEQGFRKGSFTLDVDWSRLPVGSNTDGRFSGPLRSLDDIITLRDTDSLRANALRELIGTEPVTSNYVAVQFQDMTNYSGNWFWNGSKPEKGGELWGLAGDVWWIYVSTDGCSVDPSVSLRAICGNVGFDVLVPWKRD
ncbi:MAG TPA: hypothetical protein PL051_04405 [Candidatus Saccharibacteria bacterium]|nr:hypothetical protein [Candidatus Saccharibacteria bacterium]